MKTRSLIMAGLVAFLLSASGAFAESKPPGLPAGWAFKANFDIPDAPAFELLGVDVSTILRPQTARDLGLLLSKFQGDQGGFALPRALAMEFSPVLLAAGNSNITAEQYRKYHYLYSTRLSVAVLRDSATGQATRLALGGRLSLIDEKSLKTDASYKDEFHVTLITKEILAIQSAASLRAIQNRPSTVMPEDLDRYEEEAAKQPDFYTADEQEQLKKFWKEARRRMAERYWNKTVLDVAVAARWTAADETGRNMQLGALSAWGSYSLGYGSWGQMLVGLRMGSNRDSLGKGYRQDMSASARFYVGSSRAKAFVEMQETFSSGRDAVWFLNSGLEASVNDWIWLEFNVGAEKSANGPSHASTAFKLKTALPGI